jgi:hypothetical protein
VFINSVFSTLNHAMFLKGKCTLFFGAEVNFFDIYVRNV